MSSALAHGIQTISIEMDALTSPHRPVRMMFHPSLTSLQALTFRRPPFVPVEAPNGPQPPPQDWTTATLSAQQALQTAMHAEVEAVDQAMKAAYKEWANTAELELEAILGVELKVRGARGEIPKMVWQSILRCE